MGVVNGTHQPIIIWHCRLKARIVAPQVTDEMAEFSSVTQEEQSSYTTDVRSADLKATSHCRREESVPKPVQTDG